MTITTCPSCERRALRRVVGPVTFKRRGRPMTVKDVPPLRCEACGEELFDQESNRVLDAARRKRGSRGAA